MSTYKLSNQASEIKIAFRKWGHGEPVVLLHGFAGSVLHWEKVASILSARFAVYVPNLSHLYMLNPLTFSMQVEVLADYLRHEFGERPVSIAGISYGAALAWGVSSRYPHLVKKNIFINPMQPHPHQHFTVPVMKYFFKMPLKKEIVYQFLRLPVGKVFLRKLAEVFRTERVDGVGRIDQLKGRKLLFVTQLIYNFSWLLRQENWTSWESSLKNFTVPNMLIYDSQDPLFSREGYMKFAHKVHCHELLELAGAGHICLHSSASVIASAIESFLQHNYVDQAQGF